MSYWAGMTKCPECGKMYVSNPQSVYHLTLGKAGGKKYYCSWTCMRAAEKREMERRAKRYHSINNHY